MATGAAPAAQAGSPTGARRGRARRGAGEHLGADDHLRRAAPRRRRQAGSHAVRRGLPAQPGRDRQADITAPDRDAGRRSSSSTARLPDQPKLAALAHDSQPGNLESQRSISVSQINTLTSRQNQLATTTISAGRIISDAALPAEPGRPSVPLLPGQRRHGSACCSASAGARPATAGPPGAPRRRPDPPRRRAACSAAAAQRVRAPVRRRASPRSARAGGSSTGCATRSLAALRADDQVIVVTGASRGTAATLVAANLAAALGPLRQRGGAGRRAPAGLPLETAPLARLLGVAPTPGPVRRARPAGSAWPRRCSGPRAHPSLRVITTGGTASAAGLLQSHDAARHARPAARARPSTWSSRRRPPRPAPTRRASPASPTPRSSWWSCGAPPHAEVRRRRRAAAPGRYPAARRGASCPGWADCGGAANRPARPGRAAVPALRRAARAAQPAGRRDAPPPHPARRHPDLTGPDRVVDRRAADGAARRAPDPATRRPTVIRSRSPDGASGHKPASRRSRP